VNIVNALTRYLANLNITRIVLWCYLIWYLVALVNYFDGSLRLWLTSVGLGVIVGTALYLSSTAQGNKLGAWQIIRLYLMPFFVSSFAALVKDQGFFLVFSPNPGELLQSVGFCGLFCLGVKFAKKATAKK